MERIAEIPLARLEPVLDHPSSEGLAEPKAIMG